MGVVFTCSTCNQLFESGLEMEGVTNATIGDLAVLCPHCHQPMKIPAGTYDASVDRITRFSPRSPEDLKVFSETVIQAFRAQDIKREEVEKLKAIADAASDGRASLDDLEKAVDNLVPSFSAIWKCIKENSDGIGVITNMLTLFISIITLWLTLYPTNSSNNSSAISDERQAHADATQRHDDEQQAHADNVRRHNDDQEIANKLNELLRKHSLEPRKSKSAQTHSRAENANSALNRRDRRRQNAVARTRPKGPSSL